MQNNYLSCPTQDQNKLEIHQQLTQLIENSELLSQYLQNQSKQFKAKFLEHIIFLDFSTFQDNKQDLKGLYILFEGELVLDNGDIVQQYQNFTLEELPSQISQIHGYQCNNKDCLFAYIPEIIFNQAGNFSQISKIEYEQQFMDVADKLKQNMDLFKKWEPKKIFDTIKQGDLLKYQQDQIVYEQEDSIDHVFIILEGDFVVQKVVKLVNNERHQNVMNNSTYIRKLKIMGLKQYDLFGDYELEQNKQQRQTEIQCISQQGNVLRLSKDTYTKLIDENNKQNKSTIKKSSSLLSEKRILNNNKKQHCHHSFWQDAFQNHPQKYYSHRNNYQQINHKENNSFLSKKESLSPSIPESQSLQKQNPAKKMLQNFIRLNRKLSDRKNSFLNNIQQTQSQNSLDTTSKNYQNPLLIRQKSHDKSRSIMDSQKSLNPAQMIDTTHQQIQQQYYCQKNIQRPKSSQRLLKKQNSVKHSRILQQNQQDSYSKQPQQSSWFNIRSNRDVKTDKSSMFDMSLSQQVPTQQDMNLSQNQSIHNRSKSNRSKKNKKTVSFSAELSKQMQKQKGNILTQKLRDALSNRSFNYLELEAPKFQYELSASSKVKKLYKQIERKLKQSDEKQDKDNENDMLKSQNYLITSQQEFNTNNNQLNKENNINFINQSQNLDKYIKINSNANSNNNSESNSQQKKLVNNMLKKALLRKKQSAKENSTLVDQSSGIIKIQSYRDRNCPKPFDFSRLNSQNNSIINNNNNNDKNLQQQKGHKNKSFSQDFLSNFNSNNNNNENNNNLIQQQKQQQNCLKNFFVSNSKSTMSTNNRKISPANGQTNLQQYNPQLIQQNSKLQFQDQENQFNTHKQTYSYLINNSSANNSSRGIKQQCIQSVQKPIRNIRA